jgi:hypothetical protein
MNRMWVVMLAGCWMAGSALASTPSPVAIEIVGPDGRTFQEFPVSASDGALRSYLQAEKGSRYGVRVRNTTGERLGLVIAVDGRNIINGRKSDLARTEPMYVLDAWTTQDYAGWRANLDAINEFYFTDWSDSYAEAFGDRSARGVIAVAVYREESPAPSIYPQYRVDESDSRGESRAAGAAPSARADASAEKSAGTGYGDRRVDHVMEVEFVARADADSRHFIKYEWRATLCRKRVIECGEKNRFWDESTLGFAPPPPRRHQ